MCCQPIFGQDLRPCTDPGRAIFDVDAHQQRVLGHMKDGIVVLGKDDDLIPGLFQELAAPALPADRLFPHSVLLTLQPVRRRQGEHEQGEQHVHAHRPRRFLGRMLQAPLLLTLFATTILDETAVIVVERPQRLVHRGIGQEDRSTRRATRESSRRAACQHNRSARFCATSSCVCPMAHLPLWYASLAIEERGPEIKPFAYLRISA